MSLGVPARVATGGKTPGESAGSDCRPGEQLADCLASPSSFITMAAAPGWLLRRLEETGH